MQLDTCEAREELGSRHVSTIARVVARHVFKHSDRSYLTRKDEQAHTWAQVPVLYCWIGRCGLRGILYGMAETAALNSVFAPSA